jgi:hypothetical protein
VTSLAGPYLSAACLLVIAAAGKMRRPADLSRALRGLRLPAGPTVVRFVAAGEGAIGVWVLASGSAAAAWALAGSYAVFTGVVILAVARGGVLSSCGCFGTADTPPTAVHVAVTAAFAATAAAVALHPVGPAVGVFANGPASGLALVSATAALSAVAYVALAIWPVLRAARVR